MTNSFINLRKRYVGKGVLICLLTGFVGCNPELGLLTDEEPVPEPNNFTTNYSSPLAACTDSRAVNMQYGASFDDNSCEYSPTSCADCDFVVRARDKVIDNDVLGLPPGSVIGMKGGGRLPVIFRNFHGTKDKPFTIINCDGYVKVTGELPGIKLHNSSHLRLTGTGSTDDYGIVVSGTRPFGVVAELGTTDIEIDHLEIKGTKSAAIAARTRPVCDGSTNRGNFVQRNTVIHHNYIHDVGHEGMYIGGSHWHTNFPPVAECPELVLLEPELEGVRIYNNLVVNTGRDGIQVGSAVKGCEVYNNKIKNYGLANVTIHQSGVQINPGTTGKIYNNFIEGGKGKAIFLNGFNNSIYNNVIKDCNKDAIHIGDRNPPANQSYKIVNNTMINVNGYGVVTNSKLSVNNAFYNNAIVNAYGEIYKMSKTMDFEVSNNYIAPTADDALFTDPTNMNYCPKAESPLVDVGIDLQAVNPLEISSDYLLLEREVGSGVDIGAYEHQ